MKSRGEFFALHLNARREGDQLVSVAFFRMAGRRRAYQVEARLPAGRSWYRGELQVDLPESWGNAASRKTFTRELTEYIRVCVGPGMAGINLGPVRSEPREEHYPVRLPFDIDAL